MTTNMNFGPEWMRGSVPKRSNTLDSQHARSLAAVSASTNVSRTGQHQQQQQQQQQQNSSDGITSSGENPFKYSKEFMLNLYKTVDPPAYFERHEYVAVEESQGPLSFVDLTDDEKKLLAGPVHSEIGRRMISSNNERVNNGQRNNNHRDIYNSPLHSPGSENTPGTPGRMNMRSKGRMHDYFSRDRDQYSKRHEHDGIRQRELSQSDGLGTISPSKSRDGDQEERPAWGTVNQDTVGSFDSNGVFRVGGNGSTNSNVLENRRDWQGDIDKEVRSRSGGGFRQPSDDSFRDAFGVASGQFKGLSDHGMNGVSPFSEDRAPSGAGGSMFGKKPAAQCKWLYCDPQGTVQGPFDAQEMQEWYKAGFFAPTLLVRREDDPQFESLISLIRRVGTDDEPFLIPYPSQPQQQQPTSADSPNQSSLNMGSGGGMPPHPRGTDPFNRPLAASSPLEQHGNGHFFGNSPQSAADILSPQAGAGLDFGGANKYNPLGGNAGGVSSLSTNFLQQQMGQNPASPQSPSVLQGGPFNAFGSSLLGSRDNAPPLWDKPRTPAWLNNVSQGQNDLFGGAGDHLSGMNPLFRQQQQQQQQHSLNPLFGGSNMGSPGLFDYQRAMNDQFGQHQQYLQMLQQKQQQHLQFQQQLQQQLSQQQSFEAMMQQQQQQQQQQQHQRQQHQQQPPSQLSQPATLTQTAYPSTTANEQPTNVEQIQNKPQSAISPPATSAWGSAPGTPVGTRRQPIVVPEPPAPAPAPARAVAAEDKPEFKEEPVEEIVQPMSSMQLKDEAVSPVVPPKKSTTTTTTTVAAAAAAAPATTKAVSPAPVADSESEIVAPAVKPISLREIQEEELRKQQEAKEKQLKIQQQQLEEAAKTQNDNAYAATVGGKAGWGTTSSPWGREQQQTKGPSLREIQEMEAKEAESRKQAAAEVQWAAAANDRSNSPPSNLSWGVVAPSKGTAAASGASASPAWGATTAPKKTLREIQEEEEAASKKKAAKQQAAAAAAALANSATTGSSSTGKGYAGIAGTAATKVPAAGAGWTTVTNQRTAPKPVSTTTSSSHISSSTKQGGWETVSVSKSTVTSTAPTSAAPATSRPATAAAAAARNTKSDDQKPPSNEFMQWCRQSLRGLNTGVNGDEILQMLLSFPLDNSSAEIIQDIIYANSTSMDGRRFAGEFMKRRRADLAGKLDVTIPMMSSTAMDDDSFTVVTKKGKKKTQA